MSSMLQSALSGLQQSDYLTRMLILASCRDLYYNLITVSIITAVGYDYGEL